MKNSYRLILFLISAPLFASAQQSPQQAAMSKMRDSIKMAMLSEMAIKNPVLRQVNISTDIIGKGDIDTRLFDNTILKGKAQTVRTNMVFNVPLKSWGTNGLSASVTYFQQRLQITDVQSFNELVNTDDKVFNKSTVGLSISYRGADTLLGAPVFYSASILGVTNSTSEIKRLSYLGTAIFPLKQTAKTRYSVGIILNIDPSLQIPVIPFFTYWHKFDNDIELNFNMPQQVGLRKTFSNRFWATFGTSLSGSLAFFNINQPNLPRDANYTTIDLKTGPGMEYRIGKKIIVGVNAGILTPLSARAFEQNKNSNDYFLNNKLNNVPYVNFTLSLLPFLK